MTQQCLVLGSERARRGELPERAVRPLYNAFPSHRKIARRIIYG